MSKNTQRFGLFYKSNGRWTTSPYAGWTFTRYQSTRNPVKGFIRYYANDVLKSKVKILPVQRG